MISCVFGEDSVGTSLQGDTGASSCTSKWAVSMDTCGANLWYNDISVPWDVCMEQ